MGWEHAYNGSGSKMKFHIILDIEPTGKGRPRFTRTGHAFTPAKTRKVEDNIKQLVRNIYRSEPYEGPVTASYRMIFKRPKSNKTPEHVQRPDADNCAKLVQDAMNGIIYRDDCQIVAFDVTKEWGATSKIIVDIWSLDESPD